MSQPNGQIRIQNGALDESPIDKAKIVIRGVVDREYLKNLQIGTYQREAQPLTALNSLIGALKAGEVLPDIELGMRGDRCEDRGDGVFILKDDVFIIDGLQRTNAALHFLRLNPNRTDVRIGAIVHFNTTEAWERDRFRILNTLRKKVSPNILLRNMSTASPSVDMLVSMSTGDPQFTLRARVSWAQRMTKGELVGALTFAKTVGMLHAHKAPTRRNSVDELVPAMDKAVDIIGPNIMRENIRTFFGLIDECWGVQRVQYREGAAQLKGTFLLALARFLSDHYDFWRDPDEKRLMVEAPLRRKLASFSLVDPQVAALASSGGKSHEMLYFLLRNHLNSGKRTKRLKSRNGDMVEVPSPEESDLSAGAEE